jgi:hypothetical protein
VPCIIAGFFMPIAMPIDRDLIIHTETREWVTGNVALGESKECDMQLLDRAREPGRRLRKGGPTIQQSECWLHCASSSFPDVEGLTAECPYRESSHRSHRDRSFGHVGS